MTDSEPELYVPRPGSAVWKALGWLLENPSATLLRKDLTEKFGVAYNSADMVMQLGTARGALEKVRNSDGMLGWKLGLVKRFRLDPMPTELHIPGEQPDAVLPKGPAPGKWSPTYSKLQSHQEAPKFLKAEEPRETPPAAPQKAVPPIEKKPAIVVAKPPAPAPKTSAAVFRMPASTSFNAEQALQASLNDNLADVLVAGYDEKGALVVRSSRMTCAEAAFLANKMLHWALSGGQPA